VGFQGNVARR